MRRASEERWQPRLESDTAVTFTVDPAGTIRSVSRPGAKELGYDVDELTGRSILMIVCEPDRPALQEMMANCLAQPGQATSLELRMLHKKRSTLWVRTTARSIPGEDATVILIACEDIADRKRAEILTEEVFQRSPDGICIVGTDFRYQRCNPVYAKRWGIPAEKVVGVHVSELLGADAFETVLRPKLQRCFAGEEIIFEWFSEFHGGHYLSVSYSPLRIGSGEIEAALVVQRDLTAYMRASEALREAQAALAHVNRVATMGQLTASIAHEVNQPLAATITSAQAALRWLDASPPDLDEVRQALDSIVVSSARAGDVVGRIHALVRNAPPRKVKLNINDAVREVIALTRGEASKHGVSVQAQLAEGISPVEGDRVQLQQVALNLIINAVEATTGVDDGPREVLVSTMNRPAGGVIVSVQDSGPGLAPGAADCLFDAFYTTKPNGMGIGLSICRSIIESHGGSVSVAPNHPRGATFRFDVPATHET